MFPNSFKKIFISYCLKNNFEKNEEQIKIVESLEKFFYKKVSIFNFFNNKDKKLGFYLQGNVGVGKTMVLNFFYDNIKVPKYRYHFNEFMINFHNFRHQNANNSIRKFAKELKKKCKLIYFDEFQVTNIVDAMILGKLFESIFSENIKIIITSNNKINDLYKDGLQREQFLPFIKTIKKFCIEKELLIKIDYRKSDINNLERFFYPTTNDLTFKVNRMFHNLIKGKKKITKEMSVKGRIFKIHDFYSGIVKFNFDYICGRNIGAEDYIMISNLCKFILIENVPIFTNENLDKQQRFIILIDILYESKTPLMITSIDKLDKINLSPKLSKPFKRTISRIYELTSPKIKIEDTQLS
jgi:cell division protein ZapE